MLDEMMNDVGLLLIVVAGIGGLIVCAVGVGLLAVGIVRGRKVENFDEIAPKIMKAAGVIMLIIALIVLLVDGIVGAGYIMEKYGKANVSPLNPFQPQPTTAHNYPLIQNAWTTGMTADEATDIAVKQLLEMGADYSFDPVFRSQLTSQFTLSARNDPQMDQEVASFGGNYPREIDYAKLVEAAPASEYEVSDVNGSQKVGEKTWIYEGESETWFITVKCCFESSSNGKGVEKFMIEDMESRALHKNEREPYLAVYTEDALNGEHAVMIGNEAYMLNDSDKTPATAAELKSYIDGGISKMQELEDKMGEPHLKDDRFEDVIDHYYELAPENNEALYAKIVTRKDGEEILEVDLYSATEHLTDRTIYRAESSD